jgi:hypothetical protein
VGEPIEIDDGPTTWRIDTGFLTSNWECIWGRGCKGILDRPAEELGQGCCSVGAEMADEDEAMMTAALAAVLGPDRFENRAVADRDGVFQDDQRTNTRIVDGACIFLNRPGFPGGAGCALHLGALDRAESPVDWKPSVCWQLPIKIDWEPRPDGTETATLRAWRRSDWGPEGETMAWCCTEEPEPYVGDRPVLESLADELRAVVGDAVYVELRRRVGR